MPVSKHSWHHYQKSNQDTYLPTHLERLQVYNTPDFDNDLWAYILPIVESSQVTGNIILFNEDGQVVISVSGLNLQRIEAKKEDVSDFLYEINWQESPIPYQGPIESKHWLLLSDRQGAGQVLADYLETDSQTCTTVFAGSSYKATSPGNYELDPSQPAHFQQLFQDLAQASQPIDHIVHLWSLDNSEPDPSSPTAKSNLLGLLYLVQAIAQTETTGSLQLHLITRGAQAVLPQPEIVSVTQAPIWGMGAVIANEFPNLHCTRLDLSPAPREGEIELLMQALQTDDGEDQMALRFRQRYVARLKQYPSSVEKETENITRQKIEANQPFEVRASQPGNLQHLVLNPVLRKSPKAGEVEIEVKATGLNHGDITAASRKLPGNPESMKPLGMECAGIIVNIGEGVTNFGRGDEVVAMAPGSLGSYVIADARLVIKKPAFISFEDAAALPVAYVTAYYALHELGRLQAGERVLIQSATGGIDIAAVQLAKQVGAEVFVTAESVEKREYLLAAGIKHVMDVTPSVFTEVAMKETQGKGIDLVLNSLTGNTIAKGLELLKSYGRFIEIGNHDVDQKDRIVSLPFQKNLFYFAIDLDGMSRERPDIVGRMLQEVFQLIKAKEISPLPVQVFPVSKASDAFQSMSMAQGKTIGKVVVSFEDPETYFELPAGTAPIRSDGTYLITGGFGELGLNFCTMACKARRTPYRTDRAKSAIR